jgi:hypothetical protein
MSFYPGKHGKPQRQIATDDPKESTFCHKSKNPLPPKRKYLRGRISTGFRLPADELIDYSPGFCTAPSEVAGPPDGGYSDVGAIIVEAART